MADGTVAGCDGGVGYGWGEFDCVAVWNEKGWRLVGGNADGKKEKCWKEWKDEGWCT